MAIRIKSAKTTASGISAALVTLGGIATAFSEMPVEELSDKQLIAFGAIALGTLFNSLGNVFSRDVDKTSEEALGPAQARAQALRASEPGLGR